jgi:hypothetical protein
LLVDHGRFFAIMMSGLPWALDTIASKPEHDKVIRLLNGGNGIAIV